MKGVKKADGFTLIEILVVIGLIAILAAIVLIAINPAKQFAQGRNAQRTSNVNAILNAIGQRMADNKGTFEGQFTIGGVTYTCGPLKDGVDVLTSMAADTLTPTGALGCLVPTYIPALPSDPSATAGADTQYVINVSSAGRVKISAPNSLNESSLPAAAAISVER